MESKNKPASKVKIVLMWLFLVANIVFWVGFWFWRGRDQTAPAEGETGPEWLQMVLMLFFGGFFIVAGILSYLAVVYTQCFTFRFNTPVWSGVKGKLFLANIVVPLMPALGLGLALSPLLEPVLVRVGLEKSLANVVPVIAVVVVLQLLQTWLLVWAPVESRLIHRRLAALGITPAQIKTGILVGLSNPASGFAKRFASIEEDVGSLWITPEQLIYWGDVEQFALSRAQVVQVERQADSGSTTMLFGLAHTILHVAQVDGSTRGIRLHTEGLWTMSQKRRAMDHLARRIEEWVGDGETVRR